MNADALANQVQIAGAPPNHSGVLTWKEIESLKIVRAPFGEAIPKDCQQHASCDLRLGSEYFLPSRHITIVHRFFRMVGLTRKPDILLEPFEPSECSGSEIVIPGFSSAFVSSHEILHVPNNVVGRFNLRFKLALEGLIVQMGTQVEPGYQGRLYAMLQNISDSPIVLKHKDLTTRPFSIEFSYTCRPADVKEPRITKSMRDFMPRNRARGTIHTILESLDAAQEEIKSSSLGKLSIISAFKVFALATGVTFAAAWGTVYVSKEKIEQAVNDTIKNRPDVPGWRILELENKVRELEERYNALQKKEPSRR